MKEPSGPSVRVVTVRSRGGALGRPLRFLFCLVAICGSTSPAKYLHTSAERSAPYSVRLQPRLSSAAYIASTETGYKKAVAQDGHRRPPLSPSIALR